MTKSEEMKSGTYKNYGATGAQQGSPSEGSGAGGSGSGEASGALGRLLPGSRFLSFFAGFQVVCLGEQLIWAMLGFWALFCNLFCFWWVGFRFLDCW